MNVTKEIMILVMIMVLVFSGVNLLRYAFNVLKENFLTFYLSNKYSFDKDIKLLRTIISDMVGRYIQTNILEGKRTESVDITKTKIPFDYNDMTTDVAKIVKLVLGILQPRYVKRLETLYITRIEEYVKLLVKDRYLEVINLLIDNKTIHAIDRVKRLTNEADLRIYDTIDTILNISGGLNGFIDIIADYSGMPVERVAKIKETSNSNIAKENADAYLRIQTVLKKSGVTLDKVIQTLDKDEEERR